VRARPVGCATDREVAVVTAPMGVRRRGPWHHGRVHELLQVIVDADPAVWSAAGFAVPPADAGSAPTCTIGQTTIVFGVDLAAEDRDDRRAAGNSTSERSADDRGEDPLAGIVAVAIAGLDPGDLDGMTLVAASPPAPPTDPVAHPNGVIALDHLVVRSPDVDRTTAALVDAGLVLRRERRFPMGAGTARQSFFWLGATILELVGDDLAHGPGPAVAWGLACTAIDLDVAAALAGDAATPPKRAVQPGRRILSLHGLGVPVALLTPHPKLRPALAGDLDRIAEVEMAAGTLFAGIGLAEIADDPVDTDEIGRAIADGRVWVVERRGRIEGWVMAVVVDGEAHLAQVSVAPEAAGLGLGRLLAERVHRWATDQGHASITLTTFVDVAFNGPLYERWGYRTLDADQLGPELAAIRADEDRRWPHLAGRRQAMRLDL
jgi:GNAT superfamily N-acetyltransferase